MRAARRQRLGVVAGVFALAAVACAGGAGAKPKAYRLDGRLRLNQVQVLASHDSYHVESPLTIPEPLKAASEYTHAPLDRQLAQEGVRGLEINVVNAPGEFRVLHTPVVDDQTTCTPLATCLGIVKRWSRAHPGHVPIFILISPKDDPFDFQLDPQLGGFDFATLERLDAQVRSVLGKQLITPDEVRGKARTLRDAVTSHGWPSLATTRGKIMVILNKAGVIRAAFVHGHPSLEHRAMFVTAAEHAPSAAVIKMDEPDEVKIARLIREGFIVRTRADADLIEARNHDTARRDAALRSGAQIVSTDFEVSIPPIAGDYMVTIPAGTPARCNPLNAPRRCRPRDVENPKHLRRR